MTAIFLAVIVASVLKVTWELSASNTKYAQEAEQSAKQYADHTDDRIAESCVGMSAVAMAECADEIIKSSHEAQTAQRDLAAQRGMHTWAIAMFWATAASVIVGAIGIYYIARGFQETAVATQLLRNDYVASHPPIIRVFQVHLDFDAIFEPNGRPLGVFTP